MYKLELDKIVKEIKERKAKQLVIQLPDGMKHKADKIVDHIEKETPANAFIWLGNCFGACDIPLGLTPMKIDLVIQWGHNRFHKEEW